MEVTSFLQNTSSKDTFIVPKQIFESNENFLLKEINELIEPKILEEVEYLA